MRYRTIALSVLLLCALGPGAHAGEPLWITLGDGPSAGRSYSSRADTRVVTEAGAEVILQRASGKDYTIEAGLGGWSWFQVQQIPAAESYVALTPTVQDDNVSVELKIADRNGAAFSAVETTASGRIGEWIVIVSDAASDAGRGGKTYSSKGRDRSLAILVERAR